MAWLSANLTNVLVCLALGGIVFLSIFCTVRSRRKGKLPCGCDCAGCCSCKCCCQTKEHK